MREGYLGRAVVEESSSLKETEGVFPTTYVEAFPQSLFRIFVTEIYSNIKDVFPKGVLWKWQKYIRGKITTIPIVITHGNETRTAYLNVHDLSKVKKKNLPYPVLLCHGDWGHPLTMLHLAYLAIERGHPTFSLFIPSSHNDQLIDIHVQLLEKAIEMIESIIHSQGGEFVGVLGVGHSKGAMLLAKRQFVDLDKKIKVTYAICGCLNTDAKMDTQQLQLESFIKSIYQGIIDHPELPLVQIVAKEDWIASQSTMAVRPFDHCYFVPGMHLSGLYSKKTEKHFIDFLNEFSN